MNSSQVSDYSMGENIEPQRESEGDFKAENPFVKKKENTDSLESKKQEIFDNVEKFGIKKKADDRARKIK